MIDQHTLMIGVVFRRIGLAIRRLGENGNALIPIGWNTFIDPSRLPWCSTPTRNAVDLCTEASVSLHGSGRSSADTGNFAKPRQTGAADESETRDFVFTEA